jgi:hypothetical protein
MHSSEGGEDMGPSRPLSSTQSGHFQLSEFSYLSVQRTDVSRLLEAVRDTHYSNIRLRFYTHLC